jgi:hypothetical protein
MSFLKLTKDNFLEYTLISLINVEVGVNVEGVQICQITKGGGWNKRGGWDFVEKSNAYL